jgi:hypothetical protein
VDARQLRPQDHPFARQLLQQERGAVPVKGHGGGAPRLAQDDLPRFVGDDLENLGYVSRGAAVGFNVG